jgi:DNA-binding transcriptional ArsR family regulator
MLDGTERVVFERLVERPQSPTEVAEALDVSVQTASRNLRQLVEQGYAEETRDGAGRGYKRFRAREFARVFAGFDSDVVDETFDVTPEKRAALSVWKVPQPEFHPVLLSYLLREQFADMEPVDRMAIVVYGSVARGQAADDSDVDLLVVYPDSAFDDGAPNRTFTEGGSGRIGLDESRVISEAGFTESKFRDSLEAGSQFLCTVLEEGIVLYDPEGAIRDAREGRPGEGAPQ